ncbi:MAG: hypothetical protein M1821_004005 [Bathelium mastoideum]|nr:MAG: hypothetical protein M1821_004005 [Bathelium mastoideum]
MDSAERAETEAVESQSPTYFQKLSAGERLWSWKLGLRAILLIVTTIGIGCIAWAVSGSNPFGFNDEDGDFFEDWGLPWGLITLPLSFIWAAVCILVLTIRKRPVHPGAAVGVDLVLWLALIVTTLFAASSAWSVSYYGSDSYIQDPYSDGEYYLAPNGTWVYNASSTSEYYSSYYNSIQGGDNDRTCPEFNSCAMEDAFINQLWHEKVHREGVEWTGVICQAIAVLLHFALFIWACCDTHAWRSKRTRREAEAIAEKIILDLRQKGEIVPAPGAQQMQQPLLGTRERTSRTRDRTPPIQEEHRTNPSTSAIYVTQRRNDQEGDHYGITPVATAAQGVPPGTVRDV